MQRYELGDAYLGVYMALDGAVEWQAGPEAGTAGYVHPTPASLESLAQVYVECRAGRLPATPLLIVGNDSRIDPSRAPAGKHVMKILVANVPYDIKGDATGKISSRHWDAVKEPYADHLLDLLTETYLPDLKSRLLRRVVYSPLDYERGISTAVRGTIVHGAFKPYQLNAMRPIPELGHYRSPVANVYLCGAGSHPGPGVSMAPGRNAAQVICDDLGIDFNRLITSV
jgi:phytoene dehydrogenase-like protein